MGEQEQRLHRTVAGANLADISTSGFRWREGSTKLERVGQVLLEALDDVRNGFGEGSEVSAAAVTALVCLRANMPRQLRCTAPADACIASISDGDGGRGAGGKLRTGAAAGAASGDGSGDDPAPDEPDLLDRRENDRRIADNGVFILASAKISTRGRSRSLHTL